MRDDDFRTRGCDALADFFGGWGADAKARLDGPDVGASIDRQQLVALLETLDRLVHCIAGSQLQEFLGADYSAFGKLFDLLQDLFSDGWHRPAPSSGN